MEEEKVTILVDDRENPIIAEELIRLGAEVKVKRLDVGDFICSQRVCVEYKKAKEIDPVRLRPHPWEYYLYYDV